MKSISSSSKQILHSPFVLYFVLAIALGDLLYLSVAGNFMFVAIFILIGFLASFFSKNMVVILVIAMAATSIIQFGVKGSINEGMEGEDDDEEKEGMEGDEEEEEKEGMEADEEEEGKEESFTDSAESAKQTTDATVSTETDAQTVAQIAKKQEDLVNKLEPMIKQVESFIDGFNKFAEYKP
jgi:hypothetical protein